MEEGRRGLKRHIHIFLFLFLFFNALNNGNRLVALFGSIDGFYLSYLSINSIPNPDQVVNILYIYGIDILIYQMKYIEARNVTNIFVIFINTFCYRIYLFFIKKYRTFIRHNMFMYCNIFSYCCVDYLYIYFAVRHQISLNQELKIK